MWSVNPCNPNLRQVAPEKILRNIFQLNNLNNPTAELLYTMLALWRYCQEEHSGNVLAFLEKAARQTMKFQGKEFVEFFPDEY